MELFLLSFQMPNSLEALKYGSLSGLRSFAIRFPSAKIFSFSDLM